MDALSRKQGPRLSMDDWVTSNQMLADTAEYYREQSQRTRQEGRVLRNQTTRKTVCSERESSEALGDRLREVKEYEENLQSCILDMKQEMEALDQEKSSVEEVLAATVISREVVSECLCQRDNRLGVERVSDVVEEQLKKEAELIDAVQKDLQQLIHSVFDQMCHLRELQQQLTSDLDNKVTALNVDLSCLSLTVYSPEISLKPNPTFVPNGSYSHQDWELFTKSNMAQAEREMEASRQLRDTVTRDRFQRQTDLRAQRINTDFRLRKRAHQLQQAGEELRWQHKATREEISALERDVYWLKQQLKAHESPLKLVHTRLEMRSSRPGSDLCCDQVQSQLMDETKTLGATKEILEEKLAQTIHTLQCLEQHQARMEEDLRRKQQALELELRSIEVRLRLDSVPEPRFIPGVSEPFPLQQSMDLTEGIH